MLFVKVDCTGSALLANGGCSVDSIIAEQDIGNITLTVVDNGMIPHGNISVDEKSFITLCQKVLDQAGFEVKPKSKDTRMKERYLGLLVGGG